MVHCHTVHLPSVHLLSPCTMWGTGKEGGVFGVEERGEWTLIWHPEYDVQCDPFVEAINQFRRLVGAAKGASPAEKKRDAKKSPYHALVMLTEDQNGRVGPTAKDLLAGETHMLKALILHKTLLRNALVQAGKTPSDLLLIVEIAMLTLSGSDIKVADGLPPVGVSREAPDAGESDLERSEVGVHGSTRKPRSGDGALR